MSSQSRGEPGSQFIVLQGHQTVRDALLMLEAQRGQGWWYLIVRVFSEDAWICRFIDLVRRVETEGPGVFDTPLQALGAPLERSEERRVGKECRLRGAACCR